MSGLWCSFAHNFSCCIFLKALDLLLMQLWASEMAHDASGFLHRYTRQVALTLELISASKKKKDKKDSVLYPETPRN